jgi:predicted dehydrogenase
MRTRIMVVLTAAVLAGMPAESQNSKQARFDVQLMTADPGHFHAALIQKEMYPDVSRRVDVFAELGSDLIEHLKRVAAFNLRAERPTSWELEVHTGPDFWERMLRERPGTVVVLSGRNRPKIDRIVSAVGGGLHVLADKPWILKSDDLSKLETTLAAADATGLVAYDIMTERYEITSIVQRALVNDPATFGTIVAGTAAEPGVYMESVHYLMKTVAGAPNIRPSWFFDSAEQGEGLNDIGTHLVDLVQWTLFPDQALHYRTDVKIVAGQRWPTWIPEADFRRVTGEPRFPAGVAAAVKDGKLEYYCNTLVSYALRGIHTTLNVIWDWEAAPGGGDTHYAVYRGTRARVEVRQTRADELRPEVYVVPAEPGGKADVIAATRARVAALESVYPGLTVEDRGSEVHVAIPDQYRVGHEAHFAEVASNYFRYLRDRSALPSWERPNMLAKYFVTTRGTELSRQGPAKIAPRLAPE